MQFCGGWGKHIDEGMIGCGASRFGCWQCYMVRDNDKSLDGLMKSGHIGTDLYLEYRNWFWSLTQQGWEKTRDVYGHKAQSREFYNKKNSSKEKKGMTMPKGIKLSIRKIALKKIIELENRLKTDIISKDEIIAIQYRWLLEGDINLSAFRIFKKYRKSIKLKFNNEILKNIQNAKNIYKDLIKIDGIKNIFYTDTLKRFAIQHTVNEKKDRKNVFSYKTGGGAYKKRMETTKVYKK